MQLNFLLKLRICVKCLKTQKHRLLNWYYQQTMLETNVSNNETIRFYLFYFAKKL